MTSTGEVADLSSVLRSADVLAFPQRENGLLMP